MNANVSFRHMDSSPALRDYATRKLERVIDKYVDGRVDASVTMSVEKFRHIANFVIQIKNLTVKGDSTSEDMYSSIDLALDKIERQLRRHKDRLRSYKSSASDRGKSFRMGVVVMDDAPLEDDAPIESPSRTDEALYTEPAAPEAEAGTPIQDVTRVSTAQGDVQVAHRKDFVARAMTLEEAVLQLQLMEDREFFVFSDPDSEQIRIVYKRADGQVGLIEP